MIYKLGLYFLNGCPQQSKLLDKTEVTANDTKGMTVLLS